MVGVVPPRMTQVEVYGTMAASFRVTQPIEAQSLSQSTHTMGNVGFQHGDGAAMEEPLESCQEHNRCDSYTLRSLRQQEFTKAYLHQQVQRVG